MRLRFPIGSQRAWLESILKRNNVKSDDLATICSVSPRTFRDWRREKFLIQEKAVETLKQHFKISLPENVVQVEDYWYVAKGASKGGLRHLELYGPPGTFEGRKKGGHVSQVRRKEHPERYPQCNLPKKFVFPQKSIELAKLFGIILGDGGLSVSQLTITLNRKLEQDYIVFVENLLTKLFSEVPKRYVYNQGKNINVCKLSITGVALIEFLASLGISKGNKVTRQALVPNWITKSNNYSTACLRGLVDTDGGVFYHEHIIGEHKYTNLGLTFSNMSLPLIDFVYKTLKNLGFTPKHGSHGVYLYRYQEVLKYREIVGFSNSHHIGRLNNFISRKGVRVV